MRQQESDLPPPPRKSNQHGREHVDRQHDVDRREPSRVVDRPAGRRRTVVLLDERRHGQNDRVDHNYHHGQLQRRQPAKTEL